MNIEEELARVENIAEATQGLDAEATELFWRSLHAWREKKAEAGEEADDDAPIRTP